MEQWIKVFISHGQQIAVEKMFEEPFGYGIKFRAVGSNATIQGMMLVGALNPEGDPEMHRLIRNNIFEECDQEMVDRMVKEMIANEPGARSVFSPEHFH